MKELAGWTSAGEIGIERKRVERNAYGSVRAENMCKIFFFFLSEFVGFRVDMFSIETHLTQSYQQLWQVQSDNENIFLSLP